MDTNQHLKIFQKFFLQGIDFWCGNDTIISLETSEEVQATGSRPRMNFSVGQSNEMIRCSVVGISMNNYNFSKVIISYLQDYNLTVGEFAKLVKMHRFTVFTWITGLRVPCRKNALAVHKLTGGKISIESWSKSKGRATFLCNSCCEHFSKKLDYPAKYIQEQFYFPYIANTYYGLACWRCSKSNVDIMGNGDPTLIEYEPEDRSKVLKNRYSMPKIKSNT